MVMKVNKPPKRDNMLLSKSRSCYIWAFHIRAVLTSVKKEALLSAKHVQLLPPKGPAGFILDQPIQNTNSHTFRELFAPSFVLQILQLGLCRHKSRLN
jgi:hypothetical protein